jgi:DDHD domain
VTNEMNDIVKRVYELTNFSGKVSVMGHSLGSVITWDILANQLPRNIKRDHYDFGNICPEISPSGMRMTHASNPDQEEASNEMSSVSLKGADVEETSLPEELWTYPPLTFAVDNAFMLGSPISVFLMIRNQSKPLNENYSLRGCSRVFNIFHPYDPVAYRIEPLLDPRNADVEPRIMTHWNGGFRMQYHTKRLWKKIVNETLRTQQNVINTLEDRMTRLGLLDSTFDSIADEDDDDEEDIIDSASDDSSGARRVVCGNLNEGRRIDYMLQEREIEHANEYVAALAAHSSYWIEKDLSLFVAQQILHSTIAASTSYFAGNNSPTSF